MRKLRLLWVRVVLGSCLAIVLAALAILLLPRPRHVLLGMIRREPFYEGLPASYWRDSLKAWIHNGGRSQHLRGIGELMYQLDFSVLPAGLRIGHYGLLDLELPEDDAVTTSLLIEMQPVLLQLLQDEDREVRWTTADFLGEMGTKLDPDRAKELVHALVACTQDTTVGNSNTGARQAAVRVLGQLRLDGPVTVPALMRCLHETELRGHAIFALHEFGPDARSAVPALIEVLDDTKNNCALRRMSAMTLGKIGPDAKAAVPKLLKALNDRSDLKNNGTPLHQLAAEALKNIDPQLNFRVRIP
jgi:HEAT repeats